MKRIALLTLVVLTCISCTPLFHDDFIIENKCEEDINVSVFFEVGREQSFIVKAGSENTFFVDEWIGEESNPEKITDFFKEIRIMKEEVVSIINYAEYKIWKKEVLPDSKKYGKYTNVKYRLIITDADFEEEEEE